MSNSKSNTKGTEVENTEVDTNQNNSSELDELDGSVDKAVEMYKKIYENEEILEGSKEQKEIDRAIEVIKNRKIIIGSADHEPVEIKNSTCLLYTSDAADE
mgnify:CR=1 FL=1